MVRGLYILLNRTGPYAIYRNRNLSELISRSFFERITILVNSYYDTEDGSNKVNKIIKTNVTPEDLTLMADDKLLAQVFINVIKNSIEAFGKISEGDEILLNGSRNPDGRVVLSVQDNGPGMDIETVEKYSYHFLQQGIGFRNRIKSIATDNTHSQWKYKL